MEKQTFGAMIAALRKEQGMTQLELAEKMDVTDKAVSKWERDLSFPDVNSLPKLAEIFHVSIDDLMQGTATPQKESKAKAPNGKRAEILPLALKSVALAMGVAVAILSFIKEIGTGEALSMLGIGLFCLALAQFLPKD